MTIILKQNTIKILITFAKHVTTQGLTDELPPPEQASGDELSTYQDAAILREEIENLKKNDPSEWEKLLRCNFIGWSDPRIDTKEDFYSFEFWYNKVFKNNYCISAFKATVARFLYEQVDSQKQSILDPTEKSYLILRYQNDSVNLSWQIQSPPKIFIADIRPIAKKITEKNLFSSELKSQDKQQINPIKCSSRSYKYG